MDNTIFNGKGARQETVSLFGVIKKVKIILHNLGKAEGASESFI